MDFPPHPKSTGTGRMYSRASEASERGISMIEVFVAFVLITTGIVAALLVTMTAFRLSRATRNELVASQLAAEGIEIIRSFRDNTWLNATAKPGDANDTTCSAANSWRRGVAPSLIYSLCPAGFYEVDYKNNAPVTPNKLFAIPGATDETTAAAGARRLNLGTDAAVPGFLVYSYGAGTPTRFRRMIEIRQGPNTLSDPAGESHSLQVRSTVVWDDVGGTKCLFNAALHCLVAEDLLFNWL